MKKNHYLFFSLLLLPLMAYSEIGYVEPWGKDARWPEKMIHHNPKPPKRHNLWVKIATQVILFHQNILSPVDGPRSHYRPSSSQYMLLAMKKYGFTKGFIMGCDRLLRENKEPWHYRKTTENGQLFKWDPVK